MAKTISAMMLLAFMITACHDQQDQGDPVSQYEKRYDGVVSLSKSYGIAMDDVLIIIVPPRECFACKKTAWAYCQDNLDENLILLVANKKSAHQFTGWAV